MEKLAHGGPSSSREIEAQSKAVIKTFSPEQCRDARIAAGFASADLVVCSSEPSDPKKCRAGVQIDYGSLFPDMRKPCLEAAADPKRSTSATSATQQHTVPAAKKEDAGDAGSSPWAPAHVFMDASKKRSRPPSDRQVVPGGWEEIVDAETLQRFWVNHATKEISFVQPKHEAAPQGGWLSTGAAVGLGSGKAEAATGSLAAPKRALPSLINGAPSWPKAHQLKGAELGEVASPDSKHQRIPLGDSQEANAAK